jgi:hypothetical protein
MAEIIDFESKLRDKQIKVELENDGQLLLEMGIVALWTAIGGNKLSELMEHEAYIFFFLQFSGICFEAMQEELIVVDEDGNLGIESDLRRQFQDAVEDVERELATSH